MQSLGEMQSMATNMFSAYASVAASVMLYRSMIHDMIPVPVKTFLYNFFNHLFKHVFGRFFAKMSSKMTIVVDEQNGFMRNQIYDAAETYLRTKINPDTERLKVNKTTKQKKISLSMEKDQEVVDEFRGFQVRWQFFLIKPEGEKARYESDKRYFEVTFDKVNRDVIVDDYLPYVLAKAKEIKENEKAVKLYTRDCPFNDDDDDDGSGGRGDWGCINLDHPVTFDKLAMDPDLKRAVIEDLDRFVRRKDYYKKVGKAWKRGYLLYGPPGTGKSSLIAAMANYLRFDVYDLELTSIYSNSDLRRVLLSTTNKSILVIEDIDCNAQMHDREAESEYLDSSNNKLTLSGLLNFIDGLWSTCGDERIVIFTTNHKEKLDPALLRPGRMDMHIHMGYCTPEGFDVLAHNYLGIQDHRLFPEIKGLVRETDITPAEIAEHLMRSEDVDLALGGVIDLLKQKKDEKNAALQLEESGAKENKSDGHGCAKEEEVRKKGKLRKMFKNLKRLRKQSSKGK